MPSVERAKKIQDERTSGRPRGKPGAAGRNSITRPAIEAVPTREPGIDVQTAAAIQSGCDTAK